MTESQRVRIEEASQEYASDSGCDYLDHDIYYGFIAGAEFALKMVEEPDIHEALLMTNDALQVAKAKLQFGELINAIVDCVCAETNSRNCPVHQNWQRERDSSGV
jgi:hypothetical protein